MCIIYLKILLYKENCIWEVSGSRNTSETGIQKSLGPTPKIILTGHNVSMNSMELINMLETFLRPPGFNPENFTYLDNFAPGILMRPDSLIWNSETSNGFKICNCAYKIWFMHTCYEWSLTDSQTLGSTRPIFLGSNERTLQTMDKKMSISKNGLILV